MSRTVYKFALNIDDRPHALPGVVKAAARGNLVSQLNVWSIVDPDHLVPEATYQVYGTGQPLPEEGYHVATVFDPPFVWHCFRVGACAGRGDAMSDVG